MNKPPRTPSLFKRFPASTDSTLIVRWGSQGDESLDDQFARSAERLASTFRGEPADDLILLPWLYLYRHAMELTLKRSIMYATGLRLIGGDDAVGLGAEELQTRLKRTLGHRLVPLMDELDRHLAALRLPTILPETRQVVELLGQADPSGEALRYANQLPDTTDRIDFARLNTDLAEAHSGLSALIDALGDYAEGQADALAERRQVMAEIEAEYRDDWY